MRKKFKLIISLALIIIIPLFLMGLVDRYFSERAGVYIKQRVQMVSMKIITDTVNNALNPNIDVKDILIIDKDQTGKINSVMVNTSHVNKLLGLVGKHIEVGVESLEQGEEIKDLKIPLGVLISSTILASKGPMVNIRVRPVGSYKVDLVSEVSGYGINNSIVLVYLLVKIEMEALIPLRIVPVITESKIILISQIIKGEIPKYYYSAGTFLPNPPPEANFGDVPRA